ncbi:hypothetical protein [Sandaracinus amylolyticus]|uniref:hypothetical protein n=1 Tax=Sandaracinus amylolyticus TaxID=927083 RepID=UPI001F1F966A|nr:hypothetical protein [Sandaracinus amylolyticus]UJR81517.1 Hypothetical protein I5071_35770 [Sandaracinus amylolyticus]
MRALGVRAINGGAHWVLVEGTVTAPKLIASGAIEKAKAFDDNKALSNLREKLRALITDQKVDAVVVRESDYTPGATKLFPRVRAEGVALEVASAHAKPVELLKWPTIASRLGVENKAGKRKGYLAAPEFRGVNCAGFSAEDHDALHAACAGLAK